MKFAIYTLVGVMIIVAVAGLALSGGQPVSAPRSEPIKSKTVYVDLNRLVNKHPAWQAVSDMESVVSDVRRGSVKMAGAKPLSDLTSRSSVKAVAEDESVRKELVTRAIATADEAMLKLEAQQSEVVDTRLMQRREIMKKSAEAEVMAQVKDIEKQTGENVGQIARSHSPDRINAELKVAALKNKIGKPGVDSEAAKAKLKTAEDELARIQNECSVETDKTLDDAREHINNLLANSVIKTDAALSIIESGEKRKIKNRSAASRYEILRDLLSLYDSGNKAVSSVKRQNLPVISTKALPAEITNGGNVANWSAGNYALEKRIRKDIKSAVAKIARAEGVVVVFSHSSDSVPDATDRFAQLMNREAWQFCSPVLSPVSGS